MAKSRVSYRAPVSGCGIRNYCGALAQLVARFNGIEEVTGSTPVRSRISSSKAAPDDNRSITRRIDIQPLGQVVEPQHLGLDAAVFG